MMKKFVSSLLCLVLLAASLPACDMAALIFRQDTFFSDFAGTQPNSDFTGYDSPADFLAYVMSRSNAAQNNDGYGILYYPQSRALLEAEDWWYKYVTSTSDANKVWYTGNYFQSGNGGDIFDKAVTALSAPDAKASIVMCHSRNATLNPFAPGNHPFRLDLGKTTYTLMHNGFISAAARVFMLNEIYNLDPFWFEQHSPNYTNFAGAEYPASWIDSELFLHYLGCQIQAQDNDTEAGLQRALLKLKGQLALSTNVVNFVFSDGQRLFAFRSTPVTGLNCGYRLSFRADPRGFCSVRTGVPSPGETELMQNEMVVIDKSCSVLREPEFLIAPPSADRHPYILPQGVNHRSVGLTSQQDQQGIRISFSLEAAARVSIRVFNPRGQLVRLVTDKEYPKGNHSLYWDGSNDSGRRVAHGVYFIRLADGERSTLSKVIYIR